MRLFYYISVAFIAIVLFIACNGRENNEIRKMLARWDTLLEKEPSAISDSLNRIDPGTLSRENRAYYSLLKTIADDKTYYEFKSDSLISKAVDFYHLHEPYGNNYIRALTYQGIVRTRMGITDSTVYEPLKKAENIYHANNNPDLSIGYILHYFLGNTHYYNRNFELADKYFQETLDNAKLKNDSSHIFDAYLAIFWNEMAQSNFVAGKQYLDTLNRFINLSQEANYFILNASSVYYESIGNYSYSLEYVKKQLKVSKQLKENIDIASLYYIVSDRYKNLNQLDSAMLYGQMAIESIADESKNENYLFYENVANIAEKQQNFSMANKYRKQAFELYEKSVKNRLNTQIMELEKKYDLSEAENIALKSQQNTLIIALIALMLAMLASILIMLNIKNRREARIKLMQLEHEAETRAIETKLLEEEANKRDWLIQLYGHISNRLTSLQENFNTLSQRYVSSHPKVYESMYNILHTAESDLREMPKNLIPDENTFTLYTNLTKETAALFNTNEKILLMLLVCKADNRQISTFMNTSIESIRARKSQLKKKMIDHGIDATRFF
ncbi:putative secreted protein {ECO:0000313/EMBL:CEA16568,1} [Petrimonas mucosa]|uniref:Putative secreted protein n=2 Tax=Petrimonas mucosa TaxID=1642646 RepID=A0A1G4G9U0_9BACT|nr:putative secreted protein {ECO:0000313/EMBL:CEA16568,1} [Petrimonas mucosa]